MTRLLTTLAICLVSMVMISDQAKASDYAQVTAAPEVKTAFFQPRPGGVLDVMTSPFRALTRPVSYNRYQNYNGQSMYRGANCVNGNCYPGSYSNQSYVSPCANGNCRTGCINGNCSTGYGAQNCPGGNCGTTRYMSPYQNHSGYRGLNSYNTQQYSTYRPASQPVYKPYTPVNSMRNDPFFP